MLFTGLERSITVRADSAGGQVQLTLNAKQC